MVKNLLKIFILLSLFSLITRSSLAQERGNLGLGIVVGNPTGPTLKYWIKNTRAVDLTFGFQEDVSLYMDYLWHGWGLLPQLKHGQMAGYLGVGAKYKEKKEDDEFGIRTVAGLCYWPPTYSIEIFLEIGPIFKISPKTDTDLDAGFGLRYYFNTKNTGRR